MDVIRYGNEFNILLLSLEMVYVIVLLKGSVECYKYKKCKGSFKERDFSRSMSGKEIFAS